MRVQRFISLILMRQTQTVLAASLAFALLAGGVQAQAPTISAAQTTLKACTYDTCALRLERGAFLGDRVRVGLDGAKVGYGFTGAGVARAVESVPDALAAAKIGQRQRTVGQIVGLVAAFTAAGLLSNVDFSGDSNDDARFWTAAGVGVAGGVIGGIQMSRSTESFSRAVWLYNKALPR
jgi:hypothetical protein